jgi:hypothetical protein
MHGMRGRPTPGGGGAARGWLAGPQNHGPQSTPHGGRMRMRRSLRRVTREKRTPKSERPIRGMPCHATPPRERVRDEGDFGMAEASMMALNPGHPAPPPRAIDPPLRPPPFPRRMQQERACSSALAPGSDAMYCIVYYCPRARPGHSVRRFGSVRFLGSCRNSVLQKLEPK